MNHEEHEMHEENTKKYGAITQIKGIHFYTKAGKS
jgi:hypothetical protein